MRPNEALLYAASSANLYNFTGNTDFDSHLDMFRTILSNSSKAFRDLFNFSVDEVCLLDEDQVFEKLKEDPRIFISFHTGSYYALVGMLLKHGHQVIVMSDTQSIDSGDFADLTGIYRNKYNNNCHLEMVNVEKQGAIFKLIKKIREGVIVIAYIDGNKGIGGQTMDNDNMLTLDFLKGKVKVRKGVAYLSYLTGVPVQLALSHVEDEQAYLRIYQNRFYAKGEDKELFTKQILQDILADFETHVKKYCIQWANWPYVHNWSLIDEFTEDTEDWMDIDEKWKFNISRFCPLKFDGKYYLFDRLRYCLSGVDDKYLSLFSYKSTLQERKVMAAHIMEYDHEMADELVLRHIVAPL